MFLVGSYEVGWLRPWVTLLMSPWCGGGFFVLLFLLSCFPLFEVSPLGVYLVCGAILPDRQVGLGPVFFGFFSFSRRIKCPSWVLFAKYK